MLCFDFREQQIIDLVGVAGNAGEYRQQHDQDDFHDVSRSGLSWPQSQGRRLLELPYPEIATALLETGANMR